MSDSLENEQITPIKDKHLLPYASSTLDPAISLVDRAREIESAGDLVKTQLHGKLDLIQQQIKNLQNQAMELLEESRQNIKLHEVACSFEKRIGQEIFLYQKPTKTLYFSLLSPMDWNDAPPHSFINSYRLLHDRSFKKV